MNACAALAGVGFCQHLPEGCFILSREIFLQCYQRFSQPRMREKIALEQGPERPFDGAKRILPIPFQGMPRPNQYFMRFFGVGRNHDPLLQFFVSSACENWCNSLNQR
jgi:hypothetical protein